MIFYNADISHKPQSKFTMLKQVTSMSMFSQEHVTLFKYTQEIPDDLFLMCGKHQLLRHLHLRPALARHVQLHLSRTCQVQLMHGQLHGILSVTVNVTSQSCCFIKHKWTMVKEWSVNGQGVVEQWSSACRSVSISSWQQSNCSFLSFFFFLYLRLILPPY